MVAVTEGSKEEEEECDGGQLCQNTGEPSFVPWQHDFHIMID